MTLTPRTIEAPPHPGPLLCCRCGISGKADPTVYQRITIHGEHQPALCLTCATKLDRQARLARREVEA